MADHNATIPTWEKEFAPIHTQSLPPSQRAEVCVIGAGISGLTTAYLLLREGRSVIVVEKGGIGSGETSRSTAQASNVLGTRYYDLANVHGADGARLIADSHATAARRIAQIAEAEGIDCDLEEIDGNLVLGAKHHTDLLRREFKAVTRAGIDAEWIEHSPITRLSVGPWIRFPHQIQFHPMKYLAGLKSAIERLGGFIYTDSLVSEVIGESPIEVKTETGTVLAENVVYATNTPVFNLVALHTRQHAYRTYVIGIDVLKEELPNALFWDTEDPYHYVRYETYGDGKRVLLVGGEDHKTGQLEDGANPWQRLEAWARRHLPGTFGNVLHRWSGQVEEPVDGIGYAGVNPGVHRNRFVITGDAGNGTTHGTIGAMIIADLIAGRENSWSSLYSPGRVRVKASIDFMRENANTFLQYRDLVTSKSHETSTIAREEGRIVRHGVKPVAAYRDAHGTLHQCSGVCPHLGAALRWNSLEKTWDCPAHGSRFAPDGARLNGPANCDLTKLDASGKRAKRAPKVSNFPDHVPEREESESTEVTAGLKSRERGASKKDGSSSRGEDAAI